MVSTFRELVAIALAAAATWLVVSRISTLPLAAIVAIGSAVFAAARQLIGGFLAWWLDYRQAFLMLRAILTEETARVSSASDAPTRWSELTATLGDVLRLSSNKELRTDIHAALAEVESRRAFVTYESISISLRCLPACQRINEILAKGGRYKR